MRRRPASVLIHSSEAMLTTSRKSKLTPDTRKADEFKPIRSCGQGEFGTVFVAKRPDGEIVAVKKVMQDPRYMNRELQILKKLNHKNIIKYITNYKAQARNKISFYLNIVTEYMPMTLYQFIGQYAKQKTYAPTLFIKLFAFQLFSGLNYMHSQKITHRDIKPQNIMVNKETGELKICDFGSAKVLKSHERSVSYIASRYYRAPELLFDCQFYTSAVDIWAAGCVIAECFKGGSNLFSGADNYDQIQQIYMLLGSPTKADMMSFQHFREVEPDTDNKSVSLHDILPSHVPSDFLDLLSLIFVFNPSKRPSALECMKHKCFDELFAAPIKLPSGNLMPKLSRNSEE